MRRERGLFAACVSCLLLPLFQPGSSVAQAIDPRPSDGASGWSIVPRLSASETYSDNAGLVSTGARSEFITEISPGIRVGAKTARLKAALDYSLSEYFYAKHSQPRRSVQSLGGSALLEVLDDFAFVDLSANISQQRVSAFGSPSPGAFSANPNMTETRTFSVSPYVRGRLGTFANYELRYATTAQSTELTNDDETFTDQWSGALSGATGSQKITWSLNGTSQRVRYGDRATLNSDSASARVNYLAAQEYRFWASGGRESNDYGSSGETSYSTRAVGVDWTPGSRTSASLSRERRFFGDSNNLSISHRMRQAMIKVSHGKTVTAIPNQVGALSLGTNYDYWYAQFESIANPATRAAFTRFFLAINGFDPNGPVVGLFLAQRLSVQEQTQASIALTGVRNTVTLTGSRTRSRAVLDLIGLGDDFDTATDIVQKSAGVTWSFQLNPASSLNAGFLRSDAIGSGAGSQSTVSRAFNTGYQTRLGAASSFTLTWSRIQSEGASNTYTANTIAAAISHIF
jgi:uncharacterized protein (PEP-CTERM system associated)